MADPPATVASICSIIISLGKESVHTICSIHMVTVLFSWILLEGKEQYPARSLGGRTMVSDELKPQQEKYSF